MVQIQFPTTEDPNVPIKLINIILIVLIFLGFGYSSTVEMYYFGNRDLYQLSEINVIKYVVKNKVLFLNIDDYTWIIMGYALAFVSLFILLVFNVILYVINEYFDLDLKKS